MALNRKKKIMINERCNLLLNISFKKFDLLIKLPIKGSSPFVNNGIKAPIPIKSKNEAESVSARTIKNFFSPTNLTK